METVYKGVGIIIHDLDGKARGAVWSQAVYNQSQVQEWTWGDGGVAVGLKRGNVTTEM